MPENLDTQIARLSAELNKLRLLKMESLQQQLRQLEKGGQPGEPGTEVRTSKKAYRRFTEAEVSERLEKVVAEAGEEGISAKAASERSGIPYPRANAAMAGLFPKAGEGRGTRYFVRRK